ncbi:AMP-binding protein [Candidatus Babeliales bacterium]|nr:AMP-binding protein [Candidatus Babeliales bacterium]MCF7899361.1 AMP-binding protein [Candidatus Babeliales bacterium]
MELLDQFKNILGYKRKREQDIFLDIKNSFTINGKLIFAGELLKKAYQKFADRDVLITADSDRKITYKELYFRSILVSKKLKELQVKPGDRIILHIENSFDFYVIYFAIWNIGAIAVPLNTFLHEKELAHVIKDSGAKIAFVGNNLQENWSNLLKVGLLENLPQILLQDSIDWQTEVPDKIDFNIDSLNPDELCLLLYTSGTTGLPKGVMLSSRNILINAMQAYARLTLCSHRKKERLFCVLPLFHSFAQNTCMWLPVMTGASVIIVPKIDRKLILRGLLKKPTIFFGFPALYGLLCLLKTAPLDSIQIFVSGADMLPDKIRSAFAMIYGRKICAGYGLTEASPVVAFNYDNDSKKTNVVGKVLASMECDIRDDKEHSLRQDQSGILWLRGDNIMLGYYNSPEATNKILKNGWLNTGDLASLDKYGNLAINGRDKDLIIHKGFNIYPQEIENVLMSHPHVIKAAVVGIDEVLSGQVPIAYLAVKGGEQNIQDSLRLLCLNNLAQYKIPRKFVCLDDLPMNSAGKVDKKRLQI